MAECGARFRDHCELHAFQNARVADRQGHLTDEGSNTCCVAGYSYRGVIGLTGVGEMGEDYEYGPEDD